MLYKFTYPNKYDHLKSRIVYTPKNELPKFQKDNFGGFIDVQIFKYEYKHSHLPPRIFVSPTNGKTYIVPTWQPALPETTVDDVEWIKPKSSTPPVEEGTWKFKSSSSDQIYTVRRSGVTLKCNCPGVWRSKNRKCRHIKEIENKHK